MTNTISVLAEGKRKTQGLLVPVQGARARISFQILERRKIDTSTRAEESERAVVLSD
jgi:hypothetical protein